MTEDASIRGPQVPTRRLDGDEESAYVRTLVAALRGARLNNQYPDARRLSSHLGVLSPERHRGLYPGLDVDCRSGLPSYKEWTRAQTDVRIAPDQLRQLGARGELEGRAGSSAIHAKQLTKLDYYTAIEEAPLARLGDMEVKLRRLEPEQHRAWFHVIFDKHDASGLFVRYSIDLVQTSQVWRERAVVLDEESAKHTEAFQSLIYKFTSLDSEFTLVKLATMGGLAVERVVKGVVGPFWFPWMKGIPPEVAEIVGQEGFVASFSLDMAAVDVAEDRNNDPFSALAQDRLSPEAREGYDRARERYGYKVFKDRKFVTTRKLLGAVRSLGAAQGTKNIVYGI